MLSAVVLASLAFAGGAHADSKLLLYRADSGLALTAQVAEDGTFEQYYYYGFDPGWTHIVGRIGAAQVDKYQMMIYNTDTGRLVTGYISEDNSFTEPAQGFIEIPGYTNFVGLGSGGVLFYTPYGPGSGPAQFDGDGNLTRFNLVYHFSPGWTHFVGNAYGKVLIYNANTGLAVTGSVGFDPAVNQPVFN
jgi:hypothetical protein